MVCVELIYDSDCPNVSETKKQLKKALIKAGLEVRWQEWERSNPKSPHYVRGYASPTILVDGKDVAGLLPEDTVRGCRIYSDVTGKLTGVPSQETIASTLMRAKKTTGGQSHIGLNRRGGWKGIFAMFPSIGAVIIPGISCPLCWPAYTGLLSSLGIGFLNYTPYLSPFIIVLLTISVLALGFHAERRHGYLPACVGLTAALVIVIGRFAIGWTLLTYAGIVLLIAASVWNSWPLKYKSSSSCSVCVPTGRIVKDLVNTERNERI